MQRDGGASRPGASRRSRSSRRRTATARRRRARSVIVKCAATSAQARMRRGRAARCCRRRRSGPAGVARRRSRRPPRARGAARAGGTRARGRCADGRTSGTGRSDRARAVKCFSGSRMPPLRRVTSCSPSASARTVTAHSLKAIGIRSKRGRRGFFLSTVSRAPCRAKSATGRGNCIRDQENPKSPCKAGVLRLNTGLKRYAEVGKKAGGERACG